MRIFDKSENIRKANILAEQRYLQSKGLLKENINIGDIVTNQKEIKVNNKYYTAGDNFYKVISAPFTDVDNGASPRNDVDLSTVYTAIRVKNIDTGEEFTGSISIFKKINPVEIKGLKQAKLAQDDAEMAKGMADMAKGMADRKAKEIERISSKGDTKLPNKIITNWENSVDENDFEFKVESEDELVLSFEYYTYPNNDNDSDFSVDFTVNYNVDVRRDYDGDEYFEVNDFTLDLVTIEREGKVVYKGKDEFLTFFNEKIIPIVNKNEEKTVDAVHQYYSKNNDPY